MFSLALFVTGGPPQGVACNLDFSGFLPQIEILGVQGRRAGAPGRLVYPGDMVKADARGSRDQ